MTVYQVSGTTATLDGDNGTANIVLADTINPITGGIGLNTVRFLNAATGAATVTWTPHDVTYDFANVAYTTDSIDGEDASFDVSATYGGYVVTIANGGANYVHGNTISILGTDLGGTTTANDLSFIVETVDGDGAITAISGQAGTALWPQSASGTIIIIPNGEAFIQVTNVPANGSYFTCDTNDTGNVYATSVTIVG